MPLVLAGAFFLSASSLGLFTNVGIYMLLALGLNITVGMTGLLVLGYAGFYAFGAYFFALGSSICPSSRGGWPRRWPSSLGGGVGLSARPALPAAARRLSRHRHARFRRGLSRD